MVECIEGVVNMQKFPSKGSLLVCGQRSHSAIPATSIVSQRNCYLRVNMEKFPLICGLIPQSLPLQEPRGIRIKAFNEPAEITQ